MESRFTLNASEHSTSARERPLLGMGLLPWPRGRTTWDQSHPPQARPQGKGGGELVEERAEVCVGGGGGGGE